MLSSPSLTGQGKNQEPCIPNPQCFSPTASVSSKWLRKYLPRELGKSLLPAPSKATPSSEYQFLSPPTTLFIFKIILTQQYSSNKVQDIPINYVLNKIHELEPSENFAIPSYNLSPINNVVIIFLLF